MDRRFGTHIFSKSYLLGIFFGTVGRFRPTVEGFVPNCGGSAATPQQRAKVATRTFGDIRILKNHTSYCANAHPHCDRSHALLRKLQPFWGCYELFCANCWRCWANCEAVRCWANCGRFWANCGSTVSVRGYRKS